MPASRTLSQAYSHCEKIAQKNKPYLYLVARYFSDRQKYNAFCSTYASMRVIDDRIDEIPFRGRLSILQKKKYSAEVAKWLERIENCRNGNSIREPIYIALQDTFHKFGVPIFPWEKLAAAMRKDVGKDSFETFTEFMKYAEGAAIAPATVFMFLLTANPDGSGYIWEQSPTEIYRFARELALFCYITHIIRDVASDLKLGKSGLLYIAADDLKRHKLTKKDLLNFGKTRSIDERFERLARQYIRRARKFELSGRRHLRKLGCSLQKDSTFILRLLLEFYDATLKKIEKVGYNVFSGKEKLTPFEEKKLIRSVAGKSGFKLKHV